MKLSRLPVYMMLVLLCNTSPLPTHPTNDRGYKLTSIVGEASFHVTIVKISYIVLCSEAEKKANMHITLNSKCP